MIRNHFDRPQARCRDDRVRIPNRISESPLSWLPWAGLPASCLGLLFLLVGCGGQAATDTPTPNLGSPRAATTGVVAVSDGDQAVDNGSPPIGPAAATITLGALADRMNVAWGDLSRFREINTFTTGAASDVSESGLVASPASQRSGRSVREVILPDRGRYFAEENGQLVFELVVIGEQVYARGTVASLLDPSVSPAEWIVTDTASVARNPMLGASVAGQLAELAPPSYVVPERLRPQTVRDLGAAEFGATQCAQFGAADTTETGARIDFTVAIDSDDRLCFVETRSTGISSRYVVEPLEPTVMIEPPASFRPAASPVGSPTVSSPPEQSAPPVANP